MPLKETVQFNSAGYRLAGTLHLADKPKAAAVIGCHGLLADRSSPKQIALAEALNSIGITYLRFDHRGCGDSQGRLELQSLLTSRCQDLGSALEFMQNHARISEVIGFFGSSFGGTVVLATAADCHVPAIVTYAAPIHSHTVGSTAGREIRDHHVIPEHDLTTFTFDISNRLGALNNILIMHGTTDKIVPVDHAQSIYAAAQQPKKQIFFENGDHRLTDPDHQRRFIDECMAWFEPFSTSR